MDDVTAFNPIYKLALYAPRSVDATEATVLTPVAGAPHTDKFLVATRGGVSDALGTYRPYLKAPTGRRGRVDPRAKSTDTGVMTFQLVDPELAGGDPLARWLPAFLGDLKGQMRFGGLLCRSWESTDGGATFTSFFTGRVRVLEQEEPVRYALQARELTDDLQALAFVGRPRSDTSYAGVPAAWPAAGVTVAFGGLKQVLPGTGKVMALGSNYGAHTKFLQDRKSVV